MLYGSKDLDNNLVYMKLRGAADNYMEQPPMNKKIWENTSSPYANAMSSSYMRNFNPEEAQQLPPYLNRCNMINSRKFSFPDALEQRDFSQFIPQQQQFEIKRENVNRQTRNMPYFHDNDDNDDDDDDKTVLAYITSDGGRLLRPQSFAKIPTSCTENKMNNQINFYSKRSHTEPLESSLMTEDNKGLADNSLALIRVPRHGKEMSVQQQAPLHSDILHSQKSYPQQSNFSYFPRKPFLNPFLSPHSERFNNFDKYMPNRPRFPTGFPYFMNNPYRQNCPPFRMNPSGYNSYMQPTRFPTQEYYRFPGNRMKLSNPTPGFDWNLINSADNDRYPWNEDDEDPPTHLEFTNYLRRKQQNNFGLGQPIYQHDATSFQGISTDPYISHFHNETDRDEIEEEYFTYLERTIPNFKVLPKKSSLKLVSLIPEKEEKCLTNSSDQTGDNSGNSHQTVRSMMLIRLLKVLEENIDMSNYWMDFQGNYVDSHGRLVDPFQKYITDLEKSKLKPQRRDESSVLETLSSRPPVVVLRNHRRDVITLDEGVTLKSTAKYIGKDENNYEKNIKIPNVQEEEQEQQYILQSQDFYEPPCFTVPGARNMFYKTSAEEQIDRIPPWEKERFAKEREFRSYNMFKSQFVPESRIYPNDSQIPLSRDIFDGGNGKRDARNISQQRLVKESGGPNEHSYETTADYFQMSSAEIKPSVNTKYVFLNDSDSEEIQEDLLNKLKYQSRFRSFDEGPFVTEATDESDPEYEVDHDGELPRDKLHIANRNSFLRLKNRFEREKHVQFVDEDNNDPYKKYQNTYFRNRIANSNYPC